MSIYTGLLQRAFKAGYQIQVTTILYINLYFNAIENKINKDSKIITNQCGMYFVTYRFKIRAYTTREIFSESKWSAEITTDPDNTTFLVGIIIPIILLLIALIVIFAIRR